ncbi:MAG TPA: hypothetical protein VFA97_00010 [Gaiellaceae bacterium]|nr:hypothetical protein [Gaiellaceae bacterium]
MTVEELRALAHLQGIEADDTDLEAVRDFLAVFLPAVEELAALLPADSQGPEPLE